MIDISTAEIALNEPIYSFIPSTVAIEALVPKHQVDRTHMAHQSWYALDKFHRKYHIYSEQHQKIKQNLKLNDSVV